LRRRTMPGRRAAAAVATALSFVAASAVSAAPALAGQTAGLPSTAGPVTAERTDDAAAASPAGEDKLTDALRTRLEAGRSGEFWIRFEQTADLERASTIADWGERGRYVYDELTKAAKRSQADVVAELRSAGAEFESYWINNSVLVTDGDLELAARLAAEPEVIGVHERVAVEPIEPVEQKPAGHLGTASVEWGVQAVNDTAARDGL
jgi:hypothetical protein